MGNCIGQSENPEKLVAQCINQIESVCNDTEADQTKKAQEGKEPISVQCDELARSIIDHSLIIKLIENFSKIEKESRNDIVALFTALLRRDNGKISSEYMKSKPDGDKIFDILMRLYENPELSITCGLIIREIFRIDDITISFFKSSHLDTFFSVLLVSPNFDVVSDAFSTFKQALTTNKTLVAQCLSPTGEVYTKFFSQFNKLLQDPNFVTKRFALKSIGELFIEKANYDIMMAYINKVENLMIIMNILRLNSNAIQLEAFNVFKIFVANPNKSKSVSDVLASNKDKLIAYLEALLTEKDDDQFMNEKTLLITTLKDLPVP